MSHHSANVRGVFLWPSPFLDFVHCSGPWPETGVYHRLSGAAFTVVSPVHDLLVDLARAAAGVSADAVLEWGDLGRALIECGLLVPSLDAAAVLRPFRDGVLFVPAHNPAVLTVDPRGHAMAHLPEGLSDCVLPRSAMRPRILREPIPARMRGLLVGAASGATLAASIGDADPNVALEDLLFLTAPSRQLIRLAPSRSDAADIWATAQFPVQNFRRQGDSLPATQYYELDLHDTDLNFDWVEPTVSHAFRRPTPALGGETFGGRFGRFAADQVDAKRSLRILEVGGGLGSFARDLVAALSAAGVPPRSYTMIERSPALLEAQRRRMADSAVDVRHWLADAETAQPRGESFDLIIANEVIADFDVDPSALGGSRQRGAQHFISAVADLLAPDGCAILTEFGSIDAAPERVAHLNHAEYSIHFGELIACAGRCGLEAQARPLDAVLDVDPEAELAVAQQERMLCLMSALGVSGKGLEYRAYGRAELERLFAGLASGQRVIGQRYAPLSAGAHFGPDMKQFLALILRRPASQGRAVRTPVQ